jgi:hypothetical protein
MSSASVEVSGNSSVGYNVKVTGSDGKPVAGAIITVTLSGDGSIWPSHEEKERKLHSNWYGITPVKWYPSGQNQKATLTASADGDQKVEFVSESTAQNSPTLAGSGSN